MKKFPALYVFAFLFPLASYCQVYFLPHTDYAQLTYGIRNTQLKIKDDSAVYLQQKEEMKEKLLPAKLAFDSVRTRSFRMELTKKYKAPDKTKIKKNTILEVIPNPEDKTLATTYEGKEYRVPGNHFSDAAQNRISSHLENLDAAEDRYRKLVKEQVQLSVNWEKAREGYQAEIDSMRVARDKYLAERLSDQERMKMLVEKYGKKAAEYIAKGFVVRGMTKEQVREAWGGPRRIKQSQINDLVLEYWTYFNYSKEQRLYFQNGTLYKVKES